MLKAELQDILEAGEGSKVEFKRDGIRPEQLAREIVSFANMNGGRILLGVEDDGTISGVRRDNLQAWVMDTVIGRCVVPPIIPDYEEVAMDGGEVAVIDVPAGVAKPYAVKRGERLDYYLRIGNTCQLASREQMARLFESGGLVSVEKMPVHGSDAEELDDRRLREYFERILGDDDADDWQRKLLYRDLLVDTGRGDVRCSYAAYALFASEPRRRLPQAGLRLMVFPGPDMDYDASLDEVLDLPFVGLGEQTLGKFIEQSLPERTLSYLQPHISHERLSGMTRRRFWDYPVEVIRELLVNAFRPPRLDEAERYEGGRLPGPHGGDEPGCAPQRHDDRQDQGGTAVAAQHAHRANPSRLRADGRSRHGDPPQGDSPDAGAERDRAGLRGDGRLLQRHAVEGESVETSPPFDEAPAAIRGVHVPW